MNINISNCRICLQSDGLRPFFDKGKEYAANFIYTTQLKATEGDGLPDLICSKCVVRMKKAYDFRKLAVATEKHLRDILNTFNVKSGSKTAASDDEDEDDDSDVNADADAEDEHEPAPSKPAVLVAANEHADEQDIIITKRRTATILSDVKVVTALLPLRQSARNAQKQHLQPLTTMKPPPVPSKPAATIVLKQEPIIKVEAVSIIDSADVDFSTKPDPTDIKVVVSIDSEAELDEREFVVLEEDDEMNEEHLDEEMELIEQDADEALIDEHNYNDDDNDDNDDGGRYTPSVDAGASSQQARVKRRRLPGRRSPSIAASSIGGVHICQQCNKDFSTRTNLLRHIHTHDGSKPYKCTECSSSFTQNGSLKQHMHIHTGQRPFTCEFCGRGFTQSKSLTFHMRRHTGEKPFTCTECNASFRQKDGLKRHVAVRHPDGTKPSFPCTLCAKTMQSRYSLSMHMRRHREQDEARKGSGNNDNNNDDGGDADEPPAATAADGGPVMFPCEQCTRQFATQASLVAHRRTHGIDREATSNASKCPQCDIVLSSRSQLQTHLRTVHREGTATAADEELPSVEPKPFKCTKCNVSFAQESHRLVHERNVHGKRCKRFECPHCGKAYAIKANLDAHVTTRHELLDNSAASATADGGEVFNTSTEQTEYEIDDYTFEEDDIDMNEELEEAAENDLEREQLIISDHLPGSTETKQIFECCDCNIGFLATGALVQHRRDVHGVDELAEEQCMCESCDLIFQDVSDLEAHILIAHGDQVVTADEVVLAQPEGAAAATPDDSEVVTKKTISATSKEATEKTDENLDQAIKKKNTPIKAAEIDLPVAGRKSTIETKRLECEKYGIEMATEKALDEHRLKHDLTDTK